MLAALALAVFAPAPSADPALAAVLLSEPCGDVAVPPWGHLPGLRDSVHEVAIEWEVLDGRECAYYLQSAEWWGYDLNALRRRVKELSDAPPLADSHRFPSWETATAAITLNRSVRDALAARIATEPHHEASLRWLMRACDDRYHVWDAARDASANSYYVIVRRKALRRLRELVGDEAYMAADLPSPVPDGATTGLSR